MMEQRERPTQGVYDEPPLDEGDDAPSKTNADGGKMESSGTIEHVDDQTVRKPAASLILEEGAEDDDDVVLGRRAKTTNREDLFSAVVSSVKAKREAAKNKNATMELEQKPSGFQNMKIWKQTSSSSSSFEESDLSSHDNYQKGPKGNIIMRNSKNNSNDRSWWSLQDESDEVRGNTEVMLEAVKQDWRALQYGTNKIKANKNVVLAAVRHDGKALLWANEKFRNDKEVVLAAINQNGNCLRLASSILRADKECVLVAVTSKAEALKFAMGNLNQHRDCLIAAGLWDKTYTSDRRASSQASLSSLASPASTSVSNASRPVKKVVLSTRFALGEDSTPTATQFTVLLKEHPYFSKLHNDGNSDYNDDDHDNNGFSIYSPNAFNKHSCDPNWTDKSWPCRGTYETCQKAAYLKTGKPTQFECCWRYSFRYHLQQAKSMNGFMIQIVELRPVDGDILSYNYKHELGKGQDIERIMAKQVGTKTFVMYQPMNSRHKYRMYFGSDDIALLVRNVKDWYSGGCTDMSLCHVGEPIL